MPYLNWKNAGIKQRVAPHARPGFKGADTFQKFVLEVSGETLLAELIEKLEDVFVRDQGELRLDLPLEWSIFWKKRESENRLLLAHPQTEQWVATVAVESEFATALIERLRGLRQGASVQLGEIGPIGTVSNVEVAIQLG